jgi:hypothetical protein
MGENNKEHELSERELIPSHPKVSYSREIGEAVVTENIFGTAKVRIIRKGDGMRRAMWWAAGIAAAIAAFIAWQVWNAAQQAGAQPEPVVTAPVIKPVESAPQPEPSAVSAISAVVVPPALLAPSVPAAKPVLPRPLVQAQSAPHAASAVGAAAPLKPIPPRPLIRPQSAPQAASSVAATPVLPKPLPPKPAVSINPASSPAVAAPQIRPAPVAPRAPADPVNQPNPQSN